MTDAAPPPQQPMSLMSRAIGMITSPKATFEKIRETPQPFGILFVCALLMGLAVAAPQFSEAGQKAVVDMQMAAAESRGPAPPEMRANLEKFAQYFGLITVASMLIFIPIITMFMSALYWGLFNVALGGTASFKQVLSTTAHSQVIPVLGVIVAVPFMLMNPTTAMGGPFNLGALVPSLEAGSRLAAFLTSISVFSLWGVFVNAIGLGVLYRKSTTGIFIFLLVVFLCFTYVGSMFRG